MSRWYYLCPSYRLLKGASHDKLLQEDNMNNYVYAAEILKQITQIYEIMINQYNLNQKDISSLVATSNKFKSAVSLTFLPAQTYNKESHQAGENHNITFNQMIMDYPAMAKV